MAFDAIETTVANALLLKAQMGETEPIVLKTKPFSELTAYTEKVLAELTLSNLLQEPLGKYCFNKFLAEHRQDALLQICIDIRMLRTSSGKSKRMRGLKIVDMLSEGTARTVAANNSSAQAAPAPPSTSPFKEGDKTIEVKAVDHGVPVNVPQLVPPMEIRVDQALVGKKSLQEQVKDLEQDNGGNDQKNSGTHGKQHSEHAVDEGSQSDNDDNPNRLDPPTTGTKALASAVSDSNCDDPKRLAAADTHDKVLDKIIIKPDGQAVNEHLHSTSNEPLRSASTSKEASAAVVEGGPAGRNSLGWSTTYTKDVPMKAMEAMSNAVRSPELLEHESMMEVFDVVYAALYMQLSKVWYPKFLSSGEPFQTFICHREYAETTKVGFESFQMFRALGKGAFGMVSAVQKKDTKKVYAMKAMSKKKIKHYHSEKLCEIEKAALQKVDSPFILNLKYSFTNEKNVFLVLALCNGGDLQYHLTEVRGHRFAESRAQFYAAEVILALEHLHKKKFVYRDLKPGNILIDSDGHVILSDLGLVHRISSKRPLRTLAGTSGYWAPEVMRRQTYDYTADWWSFGIFLHKLLSGRRPRCDCKKPKQWCPFGTKKEHADLAKANEPMTFELTFDDLSFSKNAQDILRKLLEPDPTKRLGAKGADEVKQHPFFADIQWSELLEKQVEPPFKPTRNDINAVSLGEISSEGDRKFKKVTMDEKDHKFYERWDYCNARAFQEEIVSVFEHNLELAKNPPKKPPVVEHSPKCCTIL